MYKIELQTACLRKDVEEVNRLLSQDTSIDLLYKNGFFFSIAIHERQIDDSSLNIFEMLVKYYTQNNMNFSEKSKEYKHSKKLIESKMGNLLSEEYSESLKEIIRDILTFYGIEANLTDKEYEYYSDAASLESNEIDKKTDCHSLPSDITKDYTGEEKYSIETSPLYSYIRDLSQKQPPYLAEILGIQQDIE